MHEAVWPYGLVRTEKKTAEQTERTFDSFGISSPRSPLRIVLPLMGTYLQGVPQPNGMFELPSENRLLLVEKLS